VSGADDSGDQWSEEREAEMGGDEGCVVGEESGVQEVFDAGDVEAAVLRERVVAVHQQYGRR
jgi:hypothetical protein